MIASRSQLNSSKQRSRGRTTGWAAFDCKQREKQGIELESDVDPYPSISNAIPPKTTVRDHCGLTRTFASVARASLDSPVPMANCNGGFCNGISGAKLGDQQLNAESNANPSVRRLKDANSWADANLIKDVLAATDNDEDQALTLLKAMASSEPRKEENGCPGLSSSIVSEACSHKIDSPVESVLVGLKLSDDVHEAVNKAPGGASEFLTSSRLFSVPVESEWEEDDVYLSHRKDAIRMMRYPSLDFTERTMNISSQERMASQHSQAASNAFLRGDHSSAHQLSLKARGEWMAAEELNNKAAKEILRIRNSNNDLWKIDLHGLHASEAVSALNDHLHKIESQIIVNGSASSGGLEKRDAGMSLSPLFESLRSLETDAETKKKKAFPQQRQSVLHVITGTGNHSRGQASLPTAVKNFLIEHGYRFDDARPGVIAVRPKFRHQ